MCAACIAWPCGAGARRCLQPGTWREIAAVKQSLRAQDFDWVLDVQGLLKSAWMARMDRCSRRRTFVRLGP